MGKTKQEINKKHYNKKLKYNLHRRERMIHEDDEEKFNKFILTLKKTQQAIKDAKADTEG